MSYRIIGGDDLGTGFDDAPRVQVITRPQGNPTDVMVEYISSKEDNVRNRLTFPSVFEYRWVDGDWDKVWPHPEDYEFGLIEIEKSELIDRMVQSSLYRSRSIGERLGGVLKEVDVHHYRIGFDEHGIYDIVSLECIVEQFHVN
jgi:hypothetical protein